IQILSAFRLHKRLQILIPEICENIISNFVPSALPQIERPRKRSLLRQAQSAVERDPTHHARVQEFSRPATDLPYSVVWSLPVLSQPGQQSLDALPTGV